MSYCPESLILLICDLTNSFIKIYIFPSPVVTVGVNRRPTEADNDGYIFNFKAYKYTQ